MLGSWKRVKKGEKNAFCRKRVNFDGKVKFQSFYTSILMPFKSKQSTATNQFLLFRWSLLWLDSRDSVEVIIPLIILIFPCQWISVNERKYLTIHSCTFEPCSGNNPDVSVTSDWSHGKLSSFFCQFCSVPFTTCWHSLISGCFLLDRFLPHDLCRQDNESKFLIEILESDEFKFLFLDLDLLNTIPPPPSPSQSWWRGMKCVAIFV